MTFECPNCCESINADELIDGRCPICGWHHEEQGSNIRDVDAKLLGLFFQLVRDIEDALGDRDGFYKTAWQRIDGRALQTRFPTPSNQRAFTLATTMIDQIKLKKCQGCGRYHRKVGKKLLLVQTLDRESKFRVLYTCPSCAQSLTLDRAHHVRQITKL